MIQPEYEQVLNLASALTIEDQEQAKYLPWVLTTEQKQTLRACLIHPNVIVLKSRGQGISTIGLLLLFLHALLNDGQSVALVVHNEKAAISLLRRIKRWAAQMEIPLAVSNDKEIEFPNGSTIDAITAISHSSDGGSKVGRSKHYGRIMLSEFSYYARDTEVMSAISDAMLPNSQMLVESTAAAGDTLFKRLFLGIDAEGKPIQGDSGWCRLFFSYEDHAAYTYDPNYLTDDEWILAQEKEQFTSRPHAAAWYHKLRTKKDNNITLMRRENPNSIEAAFSNTVGKWITTFVPFAPRIEGSWSFYAAPDATDPPIFGIDTAHGVGADNSAIAIIGHRTGKLYATWVNNTTPILEFEKIIINAAAIHKPHKLAVETNGGQSLGAGVCKTLTQAKLPTHAAFAHAGEKEHRMSHVNNAISSGQILAGPELQVEISSSTRDHRGIYHGRDDLINAIGHALMWRKANPYAPPEVYHDRAKVYVPPSDKKPSKLF